MSGEHKLAKDIEFSGNKDDTDDQRKESSEWIFVPRAALVDLEPCNLDVITASPIVTMFKPDNFVFDVSGAGT